MITRMTRLIDAYARREDPNVVTKITKEILAAKLKSGLTYDSKIAIEYQN